MMNHSQTFGLVAAALAAAQGELKNPAKDKIATIESNKGRFKYSYADFAGALEHLRPILSKHKLALTQNPFVVEGNYVMLDTRVIHESGEWLGNVYPVGLVADHRTLGSAMSYARRHAVFPLLAIQGEEEDDDAEASTPRPRFTMEPMTTPPAVDSIADTYIKRFNAAETSQAFEEEVSKARAASSRMSADDKRRVSASIEARRAYWSNQDFEGPKE